MGRMTEAQSLSLPPRPNPLETPRLVFDGYR